MKIRVKLRELPPVPEGIYTYSNSYSQTTWKYTHVIRGQLYWAVITDHNGTPCEQISHNEYTKEMEAIEESYKRIK